MSYKKLADELLKKYDIKYFYQLGNGRKLPVSMHDEVILKCAKIDLTNRIELLNRIAKDNNLNKEIQLYLISEIESLENQLTHLNNL